MAGANAPNRGIRPNNKRIIIVRSKLTPVFITVGFIVLILLVITLLYIFLTGDVPQVTSHYRELDPPDTETPLLPSSALLRKFPSAAACSDNPVCARVARDTLSIKDSTIIDATVASLLCNAVLGFHTSGLGGGFVLTYYRRQERTTYILNARETSGVNISADMCAENSRDCRQGAKAAGTPGTLLGLHTLWQRWGKLPWESLVRPSILYCTAGYNMTAHMYHAAHKNREALLEDEYLREALFNPDSHTVKLTGSWIKPPAKLCDTLKLIAQKGVAEFYEGVLGDDFALDVKEMGGLIDRNDLRKYKVAWGDVSATQLYTGHTLYAPPTPHSGDLLVYTMNILNRAQLSSRDEDNSTLLTLHRMLETYKYAEAMRSGLGDPLADNISQLLANLRSRSYADSIRVNISDTYTAAHYTGPEPKHTVTREEQDGGYSHLSLLAPDGDAVSVTSSLGSYFGAKVTSRRTGLVFNSALGDFSHPVGSTQPSSGAPNLPGPVKRPLSPASPTIVLNSGGDVQLVLGGTGGDLTTSALAQVMVKYLWFNQGLKQVVDDARIFSRLRPIDILYEFGFIKKHIQELYRFGHATSRIEGKYSTGVCAIARSPDNKVEAIADWRTDGEVFGL